MIESSYRGKPMSIVHVNHPDLFIQQGILTAVAIPREAGWIADGQLTTSEEAQKIHIDCPGLEWNIATLDHSHVGPLGAQIYQRMILHAQLYPSNRLPMLVHDSSISGESPIKGVAVSLFEGLADLC
jgi:hypothetical protein